MLLKNGPPAGTLLAILSVNARYCRYRARPLIRLIVRAFTVFSEFSFLRSEREQMRYPSGTTSAGRRRSY